MKQALDSPRAGTGLLSNRDVPQTAGGIEMVDLDQAVTEAGEAEDEFSAFRFKSFRTHKLIEEDYSLLELEEPEEVPMIFSKEILPD